MSFNLENIGGIANAISSTVDIVSSAIDIVKSVKSKKGNQEIETPNQPQSPLINIGVKYSDELETLISMALQDGEVSDNERLMLKNRAEKEGIDLVEFEFVLNKRLKQRLAEIERGKNPVNQLADAFKLAESYAQKGSKAVDGNALTTALSLIPGVGEVMAVGSLATSLIKTPSNLNALKAEIINNAKIPENEKDMSDFMLFCFSQMEADLAKKRLQNTQYPMC